MRHTPPVPAGAEREQAKRDKFYAAAEPLFDRYGYRKTTVEEICDAAGSSKRTFYALFSSKIDLLGQMMSHAAERAARRSRDLERSAASAGEKLDHFVDRYLELLRDHPVFRLSRAEPAFASPAPAISSDLYRSPLAGALREIIDQGVGSGEFRSADPDAATWMIRSLLEGLFLRAPGPFHMGDALQDAGLIREVRAFIRHALEA